MKRGVHLRSRSKKKGVQEGGANFGPNIKKPISWRKKRGAGPPGPPPPPLMFMVHMVQVKITRGFYTKRNPLQQTFWKSDQTSKGSTTQPHGQQLENLRKILPKIYGIITLVTFLSLYGNIYFSSLATFSHSFCDYTTVSRSWIVWWSPSHHGDMGSPSRILFTTVVANRSEDVTRDNATMTT